MESAENIRRKARCPDDGNAIKQNRLAPMSQSVLFQYVRYKRIKSRVPSQLYYFSANLTIVQIRFRNSLLNLRRYLVSKI